MGIDDGTADRKSHPHAALLRGVESVENALEMFRINARPKVAYCHEDAICLVLLGADHQFPWPRFDEAHCIDRIQYQVQDDLLQLNTIPLNEKRPLRKVGIYRYYILGDCASRQCNYFIDRLIEIKTILARRRFLDVVAYPVDDVPSSIGIVHDTAERLPDVAQFRRLLV